MDSYNRLSVAIIIEKQTSPFNLFFFLHTLATAKDKEIANGLHFDLDSKSSSLSDSIFSKFHSIFSKFQTILGSELTNVDISYVSSELERLLKPSDRSPWNDNFVIAMLQFMLTPPYDDYFTKSIVERFAERAIACQSPAVLTQVGHMLFTAGELYLPESTDSKADQEDIASPEEQKINLSDDKQLSLALACFVAGDSEFSHLKIPCYLSLCGIKQLTSAVSEVTILNLKDIDSKTINKLAPQSYLINLLKNNRDQYPAIAVELGEIYLKAWEVSKNVDFLKSAIENFSLALTKNENSHLGAAKHLETLEEQLQDELGDMKSDIRQCVDQVKMVLPIAKTIIALKEGIQNEDQLVESELKTEKPKGTIKEQLEQDAKIAQSEQGLAPEQKEIKHEVEKEAKKADSREHLRQATAMQALLEPIRASKAKEEKKASLEPIKVSEVKRSKQVSLEPFRASELKEVKQVSLVPINESEPKESKIEITTADNALRFLANIQAPYAIQTKAALVKEKITELDTMPFFTPAWLFHIYNRLPEEIREKLFDDLSADQKAKFLHYYLDSYSNLDEMTRWPTDLLSHHVKKLLADNPDKTVPVVTKLIAKITNYEINQRDNIDINHLFSTQFPQLVDKIDPSFLVKQMSDEGSCNYFLSICKWVKDKVKREHSVMADHYDKLMSDVIQETVKQNKLSVNTIMKWFSEKNSSAFSGLISNLGHDTQCTIFSVCLNHYPQMSQESRKIAYDWVMAKHYYEASNYLAFRLKYQDPILKDIFQLIKDGYHFSRNITYQPGADRTNDVFKLMHLADAIVRETPSNSSDYLNSYFSLQEAKENKQNQNLAEKLGLKKRELLDAAGMISPQWTKAINEIVQNKFIETLTQEKNNTRRLDELDAAYRQSLFTGKEKELRSLYQGSVTLVNKERQEIKGSGIEKVKALLTNSINRLRAEVGDQALNKDVFRIRDPKGITKKNVKIALLKDLLDKANDNDFSQHLESAIKKIGGRTLAELNECSACLEPTKVESTIASIKRLK